jgi:prepilin-type N-terminal cleavage/methylation domain-containing protein
VLNLRILKQHNQAGFTLLEVIISLAILGIVVFPISSIFTGSARQSQKSKERLQANHTAQKYMEFLKSKKGKEIDQYIGTLDTIPEPVKDGETGFNVRYYAMYLKDGDANKYEIYEENRETEYDLEIILNNISTKINGKNINVDSNDHINIEIDKNIQIKKNDNEWDT